MSFKKFFLVPLFFLSLFSCYDDDDDGVILNYFPIETGKWWEYEVVEPLGGTSVVQNFRIMITGEDKLENGKSVHVVEVKSKGGDHQGISGSTSQVRFVHERKQLASHLANGMVMFHNTLDNPEGLLIMRLPLQVGKTFQGKYSRVEIISKETVVASSLDWGTTEVYEDCYRVDLSYSSEPEILTVWLADKIGIVKAKGVAPQNSTLVTIGEANLIDYSK